MQKSSKKVPRQLHYSEELGLNKETRNNKPLIHGFLNIDGFDCNIPYQNTKKLLSGQKMVKKQLFVLKTGGEGVGSEYA